MSIFNKITQIIDIQHNSTEKQAKEYLLPPEKEDEVRDLLKKASKNIWPQPNNDIEFVIPIFDARKHYTHLKKMMWKNKK